MHWQSTGKPGALTPIVMLHKLGGWIADWSDCAAALPDDRQRIAFDLPGHGASQWDGPPPAVQTVFETAMLVDGALQEMGIDQIDLAGTSLGGCVAVALAALRPGRVRRLALPSCALGTATAWEDILRKEQGQFETGQFTADGAPLPSDPALSRDVFGLTDWQRIGAEQNASRAVAGKWIRPQERGVALADFPQLLPRITAPTLLIYGSRDTYFQKYRESALIALQEGTAVTLPDASGFPVQDDASKTAAALTEFFSN